MKLSKAILILAILTVSSFGISATVSAQDENASAQATAAFDQTVFSNIDVNVISGDFKFDSLPGFDPNAVLNKDDAALKNIIIAGNQIPDTINIPKNPKSEKAPQ